MIDVSDTEFTYQRDEAENFAGSVRGMLNFVDYLKRWSGNRPDQLAKVSSFYKVFGAAKAERFIEQIHNELCEPSLNCVFWRNDLFECAAKGCESFDGDNAPDYLFAPYSRFWHLEYAKPFVVLQRGPEGEEPDWMDEHWRIHAMLLIPLEDSVCGLGMLPIFVLARPFDHARYDTDGLPHFYHASPIYPTFPQNACHAQIRACEEFMRLPIVDATDYPHPRPERRRADREGRALPQTTIISLRRRESPQRLEGEGEWNRDYSCQWIRRGHWRRLHEPRKADGKQHTYVTQAVCGPEGKPLKQPKHTVITVRR